jgi:hypothetical protein
MMPESGRTRDVFPHTQARMPDAWIGYTLSLHTNLHSFAPTCTRLVQSWAKKNRARRWRGWQGGRGGARRLDSAGLAAPASV